MENCNVEVLKSIKFGSKVYCKGATLKGKQVTAEVLKEVKLNPGALRKIDVSVGEPAPSGYVESEMTFKDENYTEKKEEVKTETTSPEKDVPVKRATRKAR